MASTVYEREMRAADQVKASYQTPSDSFDKHPG